MYIENLKSFLFGFNFIAFQNFIFGAFTSWLCNIQEITDFEKDNVSKKISLSKTLKL